MLRWPPSASSNQGTTTRPGSPPPPPRAPTQFIDSAWRTWSAAAGYPGLYPSAYLAPPHIQDAAAAAYVQAILDQWHDIAYVPVNWYYPAAARNPALMDIVPAPQAGNRLTIRQYQTRWLNLYPDKLAGTNPGDVPGSCATGDTATVVAFARAQLGKPYLFATAGPDTYDCSGLTLAAYATIDIQLPHLATDQARLGVNVPIEPGYVQPGDLLFTYGGDLRHDLGHVAIAISNTEEIQAPATGDVVKITPIPYARVQAIRRLVNDVGSADMPRQTEEP